MTHPTMQQFNLRAQTQRCLGIVFICASLAVLSACGSFGQKAPTANAPTKGSPEALYKEAKNELDDGGWTRSIELLEKVQAADALGVYGQQALLDSSYAQWRNSESALALASIDRYIKQFPKGVGMPYALYLRGIINFNERSGLLSTFAKEDLSERDPKTLNESYDAFTRLIKEYPQSKYSKEARERLTYIVNTLAKHEIGIALFYLQRGAPLAAANRAQDMLKQFTQTPAQEEALGIMAEAYKQMNLPELRESALRVLRQNYPTSRHLQGGLYEAPSKAWYKLW